MQTIISIAIVLVSVLLVLIVLIQNSKGGGLSSSFSSSNQIMGVRKTADALEKATWSLAIALLVLSLLATPYSKNGGASSETTESVTKRRPDNAPVTPPAQQTPAPQAPVTPPQQ